MTQKTIEQKFRKLNEVEHVLLRPGRYIGSVTPHTEVSWVYDKTANRMVQKELTYNPGFLKLFDEVISNSVDHSKRPEGKSLDTIRVDINAQEGFISIYDNGGIPVVKNKDLDQWVPEMIFELRAGSNFDDADESMLTGQNGEGAALTNIFSKKFIVETCDGKNKFKMVFENNSQTRNPPTITPAPGAKGYTRITYYPDFEKLKMGTADAGIWGMTSDDHEMLVRRIVDVAGLNTHLKVYANGDRIPTRSFKDYIELYVGADADYAYDETQYWKVAVAGSNDGFQHVSFVNGTHTKIGGTHILYAGMQIWERIREFIKKKHKVDVKPSELRQHMTLFIDCSIVNPRYSSQTKEDLITEVKDYKTSWEVPDKMINKIVKSEIVQSILDWAAAKEQAALNAELRKKNKETSGLDPRRIDKFSDAIEKDDRTKCVLYLAEGDSAAKSIQGGRGKNPYIASFPLKGKPLNVRDKDIARVLGLNKKNDDKKKTEPNEIQKILAIIGLQIGVPVKSLSDLRFGKVAFATDADVDGFHICGLLQNLFDKFWPELYDLGFVHILRTPVIVVSLKDKTEIEFFTERDFHNWEAKDGAKIKGWTKNYYKGLSKWKTPRFAQFLSNPDQYLFRIDMEDESDKDAIDLAFSGERADDRKEWLETPAGNFDEFIMVAAE